MGNVWKPSFQISQTLVSSCSATAESGNEEFACRLLAPLDKKAQVHVGNQLDSTNIAWCLNACKDRFEELVVTSFGNSIRAVADFLSQLNGLTSLSVLDLPYMTCSTERSKSAFSEGTYTSVVRYMCNVSVGSSLCVYRALLKYKETADTCLCLSTDLQTISRFWRQQTHLKSLKMKFRESVGYIPQELQPHIEEITFNGW